MYMPIYGNASKAWNIIKKAVKPDEKKKQLSNYGPFGRPGKTFNRIYDTGNCHGVIGFLAAISITVFGGYAMLDVRQMSTPITLKTAVVCVIVLRWFVVSFGMQSKRVTILLPLNYWR